MLCLALTSLQGADQPKASLNVSGYGLLGDRELKRVLELIQDPGKKLDTFDATFVEDSALLLFSRLNRDGHLKPRIRARLILGDGHEVSYDWEQPVREPPLPRPLSARRLEFQIDRGLLYYFGTISFQGLNPAEEKHARSYFVETSALLSIKATRIYSPDRLERGLSSITEYFNALGYESVGAKVANLTQNDKTGEVNVQIAVTFGLKSVVRSIHEQFFYEGSAEPREVITIQTNTPFSKAWLQDFTQQLRATNYHRGYPDSTVQVTQAERQTGDILIQIDLLAQVRSGPLVTLGQVKFVGEKRTKESVMERRVRLKEGGLLDRTLVEQGRYRLSRLGVFDSVGLNFAPVDEHTRNVTYQVKEGKAIDVSLLLGWGSYELLRGGVEVVQNDLFGRAHHARLLLTQSIKGSYGEYVYTLPEFVGKDLDVFFNGSALRRDEISFTREEYGGGFGARKFVQAIASDMTVRYNYQVLNATAPGFPFQEGLPSAGVGAIITEIRHDHVDNVVYPRSGYRLFGNFEVASQYFASDVNYQRLELGGSYHQPLDAGRWIHIGISHGAILTVGTPAEDLPFNRRFFPGGDNSIRGYQQGEAAPRDASGKVVGAESYLFGSVEFEQALTQSWSLVAFFDTVSFAQQLKNYPFNESLFSIGSGISWKTVIGPVRLEYGYNLNPRLHDPTGTLQFSVGFPF